MSRLKGLCPDDKSFSVKLIHELLPVKKCVQYIFLTTDRTCWCQEGLEESRLHAFFECSKNSEAAATVLKLARVYDKELNKIKSLRLEFQVDDI